MFRLIKWLKANAGVLTAATLVSAAIAPSVSETVGVVKTVLDALVTVEVPADV